MKGFTFIEILISAAVIAVLAVIIFNGLSSFRESNNLSRARDITYQTLKEARTKTLSSNNSSTFGVHFASTSITLFRGNGYSASSPDNEIKYLPALTEISNIGFAGTTSLDVYFRRLTGEPTNTGSITIRATRNTGSIQRLIINESGLIDSE